jgi:hypothetical protein
MKLKMDRIISIATLVAAVAAIVLVLKKPAPVSQTQPATVIVERSASDQTPNAAPPQSQSWSANNPSPVANSTSQATVQPMTAVPAPAAAAKQAPSVSADDMSSMLTKMMGSASGAANLTADSNVGSSMPNIKDQQVTMEGDVIHGRFLTEIAGKDVWVTISGHMGEKDGYATFEPTEFKVGDMEVPVSLVNPALQRKLAEERDRLKIPTPGAQ